MKKNEKGFTLLEVVVSMMIFSVVIPGVFTMFMTAKQYQNKAEYKLQAYKQALAVTEKLRYFVSADENFPESSGEALAVGQHADLSIINMNEIPNITGVDSSRWSYTVSGVEGANCKLVTMTVGWEAI
jgi:prepilin-type N-terminal cleavage/methylation domain-containing protein